MSATAHAVQADETDVLLHRCGGCNHAAFRLLLDRVQIWQKAHRFDPGRGSSDTWLICFGRLTSIELPRGRGATC